MIFQHTEHIDIIRAAIHPYGTEIANTLDHLDDIREPSELKYNKNVLPKAFVSAKNVK